MSDKHCFNLEIIFDDGHEQEVIDHLTSKEANIFLSDLIKKHKAGSQHIFNEPITINVTKFIKIVYNYINTNI